jgi:hypothetical protein
VEAPQPVRYAAGGHGRGGASALDIEPDLIAKRD